MTEQLYVQQRAHLWLWLLQRITAILILPALFIHMIILHYVNPNDIIEVQDSAFRLKGVLFLIVDSFLLFAGLFHGFNGVKNIVYDYVSKGSNRKVAAWLIAAAGLFMLVYGMYGLTYLMLRTDNTQAAIELARSAAFNITVASGVISVVVLVLANMLWNRDVRADAPVSGGGSS